MTHGTAPEGAAPPAGDPFIRQVHWLIDTLGGKDQLVRASGKRVSIRTLDNWVRGSYPRQAVTSAVRDLDAWAAGNVPGYPGGGAPRLIESCGPARLPEAAPIVPPVVDDPTAESSPPRPSRRRWLRRPATIVAALAALAGAIVGVLALTDPDDEQADPAADPTAVARELAALPLPSTGDGELYPELAGSIGANTFADPRTLSGRGPAIPPNTTLMVRCRYYAPSVPSVSPDGFWYLIETEQWNGFWSPANSFMNGDVPGGPYIHNTDFAVPVCT